MKVSDGPGGSDPVEAARSWLRDHGVEAVPDAPTRSGRPARLVEPAGSPRLHGSAESDVGPGFGSGDVPGGRPTNGGSGRRPQGRRGRSRTPEDAEGAG